jgi:hypothetical protein
MTQGALPDEVLKFISAQIDSVPQLEVLLLLWREPLRAWTVHDIASRIYAADVVAADILQRLAQRRLIRHPNGDAVQYQFDPDWDRERQVMPLVAETYQRRLIEVATFIHCRASPSVREFARAFDFKKEP